MSRKETKAIFLSKDKSKSAANKMNGGQNTPNQSTSDESASEYDMASDTSSENTAINTSKNDIGNTMRDKYNPNKMQVDAVTKTIDKKNKKKQILPKDAAAKYIAMRAKRNDEQKGVKRSGTDIVLADKGSEDNGKQLTPIYYANEEAKSERQDNLAEIDADNGTPPNEEIVHNISPTDLRNLLGMMDDDAVHTQKDIIREYRMYLNNLDWKTGFKRHEIRKYRQMWDDICEALIYVPLISDVLRLKIGLNEKADFIHRLLVMYSLPMDSFEYIHTKKNLLAQYKKYESMQFTPQQLAEYGETEKRLLEIADYQSALKYSILSSAMIEKNKSFVFTRYQQLLTEPDNGKLKIWINHALALPNHTHSAMNFKRITPRTIDKYLCDVKNVLDAELYGMDSIKEQLLFFINNKITRHDTNGAALALEGLPGIGKTCIVQALAKALDLPMVTIPIGGAKDSSFLMGFSYTYEGAQPGAIVQALQELKCNNGIIFIDEIDKIPHTDKGNEISKALLHIIDPAQNHAFHDKYMSNQFDIDLSKIWFIYTLNRREDIERTLRDRIPIIKVDGYSYQEKCEIAAMHLIPKALKNLNINPTDVQFSPEAIRYMLNLLQENQSEIADSEGRSGVRQLKYLISHIAMKINMLRNLWDPSNRYTHKLQLSFGIQNFQIPLIVTPDIIAELGITNFYKPENLRHLSMYN